MAGTEVGEVAAGEGLGVGEDVFAEAVAQGGGAGPFLRVLVRAAFV